MELSHLSDAELIGNLTKLAAQNQLLMWWDQCYGSPNNPSPDWQRRFYDAGAFARQRMIMAANGVGKSQTVCAELAAHVTGEYPEWWTGERFTRGGWEAWIGSIDNDMQKRGPQRALMGRDLDEMMGTGLLPAASIINVEKRQAGVKEVADTVTVRHVSGDNVVIKWLTFEQGWRKWQSGDPKIILWDEEPDDSVADQKDILSETLTRLVRNHGIFMVGYTPLLGQTKLTKHFMQSDDPAVYYVGATWDDAPHMDAEDRRMIEKQYEDSHVDARTKGVPMLGEGRIFSHAESNFVIDPIKIPEYWARIKGIDFGGITGHPHANASLAHDRENDVVYLYSCWRENCKSRDHGYAINAQDPWIPVAWPHDGHKHDPRSGREFQKIYRNDYHVNMLSKSARYKNDTGGAQAQEPIIQRMNDRLEVGKFKVFRTCTPWLEEYRSYHRKEGKIVSTYDDVLKAAFYALMMLRFARTATIRQRIQQMPAVTT